MKKDNGSRVARSGTDIDWLGPGVVVMQPHTVDFGELSRGEGLQ